MTSTSDPEPVAPDGSAISAQDSFTPEGEWSGSSKAIVVAGEAGLLAVILGGVVLALRSLIRAVLKRR